MYDIKIFLLKGFIFIIYIFRLWISEFANVDEACYMIKKDCKHHPTNMKCYLKVNEVNAIYCVRSFIINGSLLKVYISLMLGKNKILWEGDKMRIL